MSIKSKLVEISDSIGVLEQGSLARSKSTGIVVLITGKGDARSYASFAGVVVHGEHSIHEKCSYSTTWSRENFEVLPAGSQVILEQE